MAQADESVRLVPPQLPVRDLDLKGRLAELLRAEKVLARAVQAQAKQAARRSLAFRGHSVLAARKLEPDLATLPQIDLVQVRTGQAARLGQQWQRVAGHSVRGRTLALEQAEPRRAEAARRR
ncbi:MAG: hypothetical protein ACHP79_17400, partial [Terriglobales bacterium]